MIIAALFLLSLLGDWAGIGLIWPLMLYVYREDKKAQLKLLMYTSTLFAALLALDGAISNPECPYISLFQFGMLPAIPLIGAYNGALGGKRGGKWFFYVYYPAHLLLICLVDYLL